MRTRNDKNSENIIITFLVTENLNNIISFFLIRSPKFTRAHIFHASIYNIFP